MTLLSPNTLTRHAVCLGATGSGKTGLCTGCLEDLALAGIPLLIIDLKGDMSNMVSQGGLTDPHPGHPT